MEKFTQEKNIEKHYRKLNSEIDNNKSVTWKDIELSTDYETVNLELEQNCQPIML